MQDLVINSCPGIGDGPCCFQPTRISAGENTVFQCNNCGIGVTLPEIDDVASLYTDRESWDFQPRSSTLALALKRIAFRARARSFLQMVPNGQHIIADYGCGSGLFTSCVNDVAGTRVFALDFHDNAPVELDGPIYLPFSRQHEIAGMADLLIASHVLEHETDPVALLRRMAEVVKPGGHIILEVPNVDCWGATVFGIRWDGWYLPFHRIHFSRISLRATAERAGLVVLAERDVSVPTMGRTLANLLGRNYSFAFLLAGAVLQPIQWLIERLTRRPSALRMVCRKA